MLNENLAQHFMFRIRTLLSLLFIYFYYFFFFFSLFAQEKCPLKAHFFVQKFGVYKHRLEEFGRVHVCINFPLASVLCWLLSFSLISIMSTEKEQTIIVSTYLFSVALNISNVCHWKQYYICSLGVNFVQNSLIPRHYRPHVLIHDFPVSEIKVVFVRLFRHL